MIHRPAGVWTCLVLGGSLIVTMLLTACESRRERAKSPDQAPATEPAALTAAPDINLALPYEKFTLSNGLDVIFHVDRTLPNVHVNLWYHVGSKDERRGRSGFAHLFEHMMFQGSGHAPGEYLTRVEQAGANLRAGGVNGTTSVDRTNYFQTVPKNALAYVLWLESDRMGYLLDSLDETVFENQREVVKNEKRQIENRPYAARWELIARHMYSEDHPYGHTVIGSMDDLNRASLSDVQEFFRTFYAPNNASLAITGDFDPDSTRKLVESFFGSLPPGQPVPRVKVKRPILADTIKIVREEFVPQSRLHLVWHTPEFFHPDELALDYAAEILTNGRSSRLFKRLIEKEQLAAEVAAYHEVREASGLFHVDILARPNASMEAIKNIVLQEMSELGDDGPSTREMEQTRANMRFNILTQLERIGGFGGKADLLNRYNTFLNNPGAFREDMRRTLEVSKPAIERAVNRWLVKPHHLDMRFVATATPSAAPIKPERSQPPAIPSTPPPEIAVPTTWTLPNGVQVLHLERGQTGKLAVTALLRDGADATIPATTAELMIKSLAAGAAKRSSDEVQALLRRHGMKLDLDGDIYGAHATLRFLKEHTKQAFDLISSMVQEPQFEAVEVMLNLQRLLDKRTREQFDPAAIASHRFPGLVYGEQSPVGRAAWEPPTQVEQLDVEGVKAYWEQVAYPENLVLVVVGDVSESAARDLAQTWFGNWQKAAPTQSRPAIANLAPAQGVKIHLFDVPGAKQTVIRWGGKAPTRAQADEAAIRMTNAILGGTFSSRLNLNLREDKGYSYGAYSQVLMRREFGLRWVATSVETPMTIPALMEIRKEITRLRQKKNISAGELNNIRDNLTRGYIQNFATLNQLVREITPFVNEDMPLLFMQEYPLALAKLEPETLVKQANKLWPVKSGVILLVGDANVIADDVRDLGWAEVTVHDLARPGNDQGAESGD